MPPLSLALAAYKRGVGRQPELVTLNVYAEKTPRGFDLIQRGGLGAFALVGSGPIRAIFQRDGLLNNDTVIVSGTEVYRVSSGAMKTLLVGAVPGRSRVSIDGGRDSSGNDVIRIANGTGLYVSDGVTVTQEDFPSAGLKEGVTAIRCHRGFWIAVHADSEKAYTLIPGDVTWNALGFVTAEYKPDRLKGLGTRGDQLTLNGEETTEFWTLSGSTSPPLEPVGGMIFDHGIRARDTLCNVGDALFYVDNHCQVRRTIGGAPEIVSDADLAEQIRAVDEADLRAWSYTSDGHEFYVLTLGTDATLVFDTKTEFWHRRSSKGYDYWRAHLGVDLSGQVLCCDSIATNPQVWLLDPNRLDDDGDEIIASWTSILSAAEGTVNCDRLTVDCAAGVGTQTGQGSDPALLMKFSDDEGNTWTREFSASLGAIGRTSTRVQYNRLGQTRGPKGRLFQFLCSDPVVKRFAQPILNEAA